VFHEVKVGGLFGFLCGEEDFGAAEHGGSFVGMDDVDGFRAFCGDVDIVTVAEAGVVFLVVEFEAEVFEAGDDIAADFGVAFADGGGEDEGVGAAHGGDHFADGALDAIDIHVIGELGAGVRGAQFENVAHVAGDAADAEEAALAVQIFFDGFVVQAEFVLDGDGGGRVDVAGAGCHHDAFERGVAHGRIVGVSAFNRGERGARTEVASDDALGEKVVITEVVADSAHRKTVIAIALDFGTIREVDVDSVELVDFVAGMVEVRVGDDDDGGFGESFDAFGDFGGDDRDVERGATFLFFEEAETLIINDVVVVEKFAGRNDTSKDTVEGVVDGEIAGLGENIISIADGVGDAFEAVGEFLSAAVGVFQGAD